MRLLITLFLVYGLNSLCSAQAIEKGYFLCTSMRTEAWNNETQKLDITRDWVNLPQQAIALHVFKDSILYYTDNYKTKNIYKVDKVTAQPDIDSFADHFYEVEQNGIKSLITVRLLSGYEGYAGQIKIADGPAGDHFTRVITYTFTKQDSDRLASR
ncbi:hypothetical protein [Mucilaginibacter sp. CSA2-8R]|uniref:hypothetical protein n=1 Tax=Mucilaginibacter sp. CSA2-8R TaxID=3141542 RepID=UPI00315CD8D0